jgi:hypothetical protein
MAWTEIETYRQLEQEYQQELAGFKLAEAAYREGTAQVPPPNNLREQYEQLAAKRVQLESMLERLRQMRHNLAHKREEVAQELVF